VSAKYLESIVGPIHRTIFKSAKSSADAIVERQTRQHNLGGDLNCQGIC